MKKLSHFINGKELAGNSGRYGDVFDPATGQVQKQVPLASVEELDAAVRAAAAAFPDWAAMPVLRRARCMFRLKILIEDIKAISFVGSTPIAKKIFEVGSANGKRIQALGGAKNHMLVMPDAPIDVTADALMGSAYGSAGERCMAISVAVVIGDETAEALIAELKPRVQALCIEPGHVEGAEMGPLITQEHHIYGPEGIRFYTRVKAITQRWHTGIRKGADFHFPQLG